jgi:alanyl-tRNA synthetase
LYLFRVAIFAYVTSEHISRGLNAKAWCDDVLKTIGIEGKGGGRPEQANAVMAAGRDAVAKAESIARSYSKRFV